MADRKRAELAAHVVDACEGLAECGFLGIMEVPILKVFTELHKLNDTIQLSKLVAGLEDAATRTVSAKGPPCFPELMVLSQLLADVEGPAGPPEGEDSPLDTEFKSLAANLRLALCAALQQFARPGSEEARQGVTMSAGMLLMLHEKVAGDLLVTLAVEHALLRLLFRGKSCVVLLRDRTWALAALNKQVEALKEFKDGDAEAEGEGGEEMDGGEGEDDGESEGDAEAEGEGNEEEEPEEGAPEEEDDG